MHSMLQNKCIGTADDHVCYNLSVVCVRVHTCRINAQEATLTYTLSLCGAYGLQCRTGPNYGRWCRLCQWWLQDSSTPALYPVQTFTRFRRNLV